MSVVQQPSAAVTAGQSRQDEYHLWHPFTQMRKFLDSQMLIVERGQGVYLYDQNGKQYLNLNSCLWNAPLGLGRPEIIEAVVHQLHELSYSSLFRFAHRPAVNLAQKIARIVPGRLNRVFLTSNGSESVETAIKMVRKYFHLQGTRKYKVISLEGAYHGVSYGALAASGFVQDKAGFGPMPDGFCRVPAPHCQRARSMEERKDHALYCAEALEKTIVAEGPDTVAMFIMEPVQAMGGVMIPPDEYFKAVTATCRKYGIKFVLDEVTTGFGRTGTLFAAEHWDLAPDVLCLGKAISGGYLPLGAAVATDEIWSAFLGDNDERKFNHGSTYAGYPGACAAGLAAIDLLTEDGLIEKAAQRGEQFLRRLRELLDLPAVDDVRGIGMMFAIDLVRDAQSREPLDSDAMEIVMRAFFARGLWVHASGSKILMFPPLVIEDEQLDEAFASIRKILFRVPRWI